MGHKMKKYYVRSDVFYLAMKAKYSSYWAIADLARDSCYSVAYLNRCLILERAPVTQAVAKTVSNVLGVPFWYMFGTYSERDVESDVADILAAMTNKEKQIAANLLSECGYIYKPGESNARENIEKIMKKAFHQEAIAFGLRRGAMLYNDEQNKEETDNEH